MLHTLLLVGNDGNTIFHIVCAEDSSKLTEFLVKNGADSRYGDAPIHIACKHARIGVLKLILNCSPNQQNASGDTALHHNEKQLLIINTLTSTVGIVHHEGHTHIEVELLHRKKCKIFSHLV